MRSTARLVAALAAFPLVAHASVPRPVITSGLKPHTPHPAARVIHIIARNYAFTAPDTIKAGLVTFHLMNQGTEPHHAFLVRFAPGHTLADFVTAMKAGGEGFPAWVTPVGGPNAPAPGGTANATMVLTPGSYAFICMVPTPDSTPMGTPHVMKGMMHALTVVPGAAGASAAMLPPADKTITLADYSFTLSRPLSAGPQVVRVTNAGSQIHEVEFVRLMPDKTPQDAISWFFKPVGPPPGIPLGGVVGLPPGGSANTRVDLTPGNYGLICFLPDAKDGKPHFMHGMTMTVHVK